MQSDKDSEKFIKILMKFRNNFPKHSAVYIFFLLVKLLPIFIITHDWNLNYGKGISSIFAYITLSFPLFKLNSKLATQILMMFFSALSLIPIFIFFYTFRNYKNFGKFFKCDKYLINKAAGILFFTNYLLNQYFYSILVENYLCGVVVYDANYDFLLISSFQEGDCRTTFNYVTMCIQTILFFFFFFISYLITILIFEPFFTSDIMIGNSLNSSNYKWVLFPLMQGIVQLEYHVPFKVAVFIKIAVRILFAWFYIVMIFSEFKNVYPNKKVFYFINYILTMCFVSVIIEFGFLYDFDNKLTILQSDVMIVVFKLLIELFTSGIIIKLVQIKETNFLSTFTNFNSHKNNSFLYESYNKFFYYLYSAEKENNIETVTKILKTFNDSFVLHKKNKKCKLEECYCYLYEVNDIYKKSNIYFKKIKMIKENKILREERFIKNNLPALYSHLKVFLEINVEKFSGPQDDFYAQYLLIGIFFYKIVDRNFNKCLFYLEEFRNTSYYKDNFIVKVQTFLIKIQIEKGFSRTRINMKSMDNKNELKNGLSKGSTNLSDEKLYTNFRNDEVDLENFKSDKKSKIYKMFHKFKFIKKLIFLENWIKKTFNSYSDLINKLQENNISLKLLRNNFEDFELVLNQTDYIIKQTLLENKIDVKSKISNTNNINYIYPFIGNKLFLFNKFFKSQTFSHCDYEKFFYNFKLEEFDVSNSFVIIKLIKDEFGYRMGIEYASQLICEELKYSFDEITKMDFEDFFPTFITKCFREQLLSSIREGTTKIDESEMCLQSKDEYSKLYDFKGIVMIFDNSIRIFASLNHIKFQIPEKGKKKKKYKQKSKETCFAFCKTDGTIFSISQEFERYFYLTVGIVKKLKLNLFKDILKIENFNKRKLAFNKPLSAIYMNISELNFNYLYESYNEEFKTAHNKISNLPNIAKTVDNISIIITLEEKFINKNKVHLEKHFFYVKFTTQHFNVMTSLYNVAFFKDKTFAFTSRVTPKNSNYPLRAKAGGVQKSNDLNTSTCTSNFQSNKNLIALSSGYNLNENIDNINKQVKNVREISFKLLYFKYNINKTQILPEKQSDFNFGNLDATFASSCASNLSKLNNIQKHKLNRSIDTKIFFMMFFMILFLVIFLIYLFIVQNYQDSLYTEGFSYLNEIYSLELYQNVLYGVIGSVIQMQLVTNKLQPEVIDNGFRNDYGYHKEKLQMRVNDYINYFKYFQNFHSRIPLEKEKALNVFWDANITNSIMNLKYENEHTISTLWDSLYYLHLTLNDIVTVDSLEPLKFNKSDGLGNHVYIDRNAYQGTPFFKSESASVFLIENSLTSIKYPLNELLNYNQVLVSNFSNDSREFLFVLYIIIVLFLLCMFAYQPYVYFRIYNVIFSKYFVNFNYFRFFNNLLQKKTAIVNDFIRNSVEESYERLLNSNVTIVGDNSDKELKEITSDNCLNYNIKKFEVKVSQVMRYSSASLNSNANEAPSVPMIYIEEYHSLNGMDKDVGSEKTERTGRSQREAMRIPDNSNNSYLRNIHNSSSGYNHIKYDIEKDAIIEEDPEAEGGSYSKNEINAIKGLIKKELVDDGGNNNFNPNTNIDSNSNSNSNADSNSNSNSKQNYIDIRTMNSDWGNNNFTSITSKYKQGVNSLSSGNNIEIIQNEDLNTKSLQRAKNKFLVVPEQSKKKKLFKFLNKNIITNSNNNSNNNSNSNNNNLLGFGKNSKNSKDLKDPKDSKDNTVSRGNAYETVTTPTNSNVPTSPKITFFSNLNTNNTHSSNSLHHHSSTIVNTSQMNHTLSNLITRQSEVNQKRLLAKPNNFWKYIWIFSLTFIILTALSFSYYAVTASNLEGSLKTSYCIKVILERVSIMTQLLFAYQFSVLQNKPLKYTYVSKGYLNNSLENAYLNDITDERDVFNEIVSKYNFYKIGMRNIVSGNTYSIFDTTIELEKLMNTKDFCKVYSETCIQYKDTFGSLLIQELKNATNSSLYDECLQIGFGFNHEGLLNALDSLYSSIINQYNDFLKDPARSAESNYLRLNDPALLTFQVETHELFYKFYLSYIHFIEQDYTNSFNESSFVRNIFLALISVFILLLIMYYVFAFSMKFIRQDRLINSVEDAVISSLLF